uniref:Uncharacterized protein n=1 Tax=Oryzias melastigma TaxID=30732 RepID=A0A3B3DYK5_ORYME
MHHDISAFSRPSHLYTASQHKHAWLLGGLRVGGVLKERCVKTAIEENKRLVKQVESLRVDIEKQTHVEQMCEEERIKTSQVSESNQDLRTVMEALQSKLQQLKEMKKDISSFKSKQNILEQEKRALESQLKRLQKKTAHKAHLEPDLKKEFDEFQLTLSKHETGKSCTARCIPHWLSQHINTS